jgi:hypothetical protein
VTGVYRDGQGWAAKSVASDSRPAPSLGIDVQLQVGNCGSLAAVAASKSTARGLAVGCLGDDTNQEQASDHDSVDVRYGLTMPRAHAEAPRLRNRRAEQYRALRARTAVSVATAIGTGALSAMGSLDPSAAVSLIGTGTASTFLIDPAAGDAPRPLQDPEVAPAVAGRPAKVTFRHGFGLVIGGSPMAQRGRLPGTSVIRIPLGSLLSIQYRDDMVFPVQETTRK